MKTHLHVPPKKLFLPWIAGIAVGSAVWIGLLFLADASGALAIYVGAIVGLNAGAFVAAGIARPADDDGEEPFILNPRDEMLGGKGSA